jgi:hypothetical protein
MTFHVAPAVGSYGRGQRKKTAKSFAALRQEGARRPAKNNAAFRLEGGTISMRVDPALSFIPIRRKRL